MIDKLMSICISLSFLFIFIFLVAIPVLVFLDTDILFWVGLIGELTCWIMLPLLEVIDYMKECKK